MSDLTIYDFDTRHAPFEAFASAAPYAPWVILGWCAMPAQWWTNACLDISAVLFGAMVRTLVYPLPVLCSTTRHEAPADARRATISREEGQISGKPAPGSAI